MRLHVPPGPPHPASTPLLRRKSLPRPTYATPPSAPPLPLVAAGWLGRVPPPKPHQSAWLPPTHVGTEGVSRIFASWSVSSPRQRSLVRAGSRLPPHPPPTTLQCLPPMWAHYAIPVGFPLSLSILTLPSQSSHPPYITTIAPSDRQSLCSYVPER